MASLVDAYFKIFKKKTRNVNSQMPADDLAERTEPAAPPFSFTNLPQTRTAVADELSSRAPSDSLREACAIHENRTLRVWPSIEPML
jgi:hypothetical protein